MLVFGDMLDEANSCWSSNRVAMRYFYVVASTAIELVDRVCVLLGPSYIRIAGGLPVPSVVPENDVVTLNFIMHTSLR